MNPKTLEEMREEWNKTNFTENIFKDKTLVDIEHDNIFDYWLSKLSTALEKEREEVIKSVIKIVDDYDAWAFRERNININQDRTMLAYDMDSRQVATKQIKQKILSLLTPKQ